MGSQTESEQRGNPEFGKRLKSMLEDRNINQADFADEVGCDRSTVSRWTSASRTPSVGFVLKMIEFLEIQPEDQLEFLVGAVTSEEFSKVSIDAFRRKIERQTVGRLQSAVTGLIQGELFSLEGETVFPSTPDMSS